MSPAQPTTITGKTESKNAQNHKFIFALIDCWCQKLDESNEIGFKCECSEDTVNFIQPFQRTYDSISINDSMK